MQPWIEDEGGDPVLWMTGIPGSGKTFLCSLVIEHLQTRKERSSLYYICGKHSTGGDTRATILRTLTVQLLQQNPGMVPLVHQAYLQKMSNRSAPALESMLGEILPTVNVTRIVIDGIDEGHQEMQKETLKSLLKIQKLADCNCKLLVSSRKEPQIRDSLLPKTHLRLGQQTSEALGLYIKEKLKEVRAQFPDMDCALAKLVEDRLSSKAKGMFLWVRLVVAMLTQQVSETELENTINRLPDGLDEAYGIILTRIGTSKLISRDRAFKILYWVCAAYRPVKIHEVVDGIALHSGQTLLDKKTRSNNPQRDVVELCAPLLEISSNGNLSLVHFSAKEYLVHEQSGPFIDPGQAHLSLAYSCITNLITCLDLVPGYRTNINSMELESRVVKGRYGLQSYGFEFWAEHVIAYLSQVGDPDAKTGDLIHVLERFCEICKHPTGKKLSLPASLSKEEIRRGLAKVDRIPAIYNLIAGWLLFKSDLVDARSFLTTVDLQQQWRLRNDLTYLSLIDLSLCNITERLLEMKAFELPSHIDEKDYKAFIARFDLPCRFLDCNTNYRSAQERDTHEASHVPSFPCLQCDFAIRGFVSRKDLEKHTQKYHMSPEDFEIPTSLNAAIGNVRGKGTTSMYAAPKTSRCWNAQGRKALQHGFSQVLAKIESCQPLSSPNDTGGSHTGALDVIREKIEAQQYNSLVDFKSDLGLASKTSEITAAWAKNGILDSLCDVELEKAVSGYPVLARFDHVSSKIGQNGTPSDTNKVAAAAAESLREPQVNVPSSENFLTMGRRPYWSIAEDEQFPELLERCGRDFLKIADYLKTKTVDEVDRHFEDLLQLGKPELSDLADLADSRLRQERDMIGTKTDAVVDEAESCNISNVDSDMPTSQPSSSQSVDAISPYVPRFDDLSAHRIMHPALDAIVKRTRSAALGQAPDGPVKAKRKPRPRALCIFCSSELHDEYAVKKHVSRFHTATRKVWTCEDISIDKRFLSKCRSCLEGNRYSSKNHASKHLRQAHFDLETSADTLHRWMREVEEPNSNFQMSKSKYSSIRRPSSKRQKTGKQPLSLAPIHDQGDSPQLLPSMNLYDTLLPLSADMAPDCNDVTSSGGEEDEMIKRIPSPANSTSKPSNDGDLLPDVSFDNMLPGVPSPVPDNRDGLPHRTNRSLIRPDQVLRLPHLEASRKLACQDQVTALHQKLDRENVGSVTYKEELDNLVSLSRTLMNNLRDWRRHEIFVPEFPFSF